MQLTLSMLLSELKKRGHYNLYCISVNFLKKKSSDTTTSRETSENQ